MANYVIAHDLGTTGNKATLYDREGALAGAVFYAYDTEYAHTGWAEQNPNDWWEAVCLSTRQLLSETKVSRDDIGCITFSGQMMGAVPLDRDARPLRNAIIWADQRALDQERWIGERVSFEDVYRITGHRLSASYSLAKILWIRDNQPDIYSATHKFVHAKDSIVARLTGEFVTDPSDGSSMNLYDLESGEWSSAILDAVELPAEKLPRLRDSIAVVGAVRAAVADEVGVAAGTPVVIGGGDGACAAAGAGVIKEGSAYNYVGSSSWIALSTPEPIYDPDYRTFTFGHVIPDMVMPTGTMQAAGASYQWTRDQLAPFEKETADRLGISAYELINLEIDQVAARRRGAIFPALFAGRAQPALESACARRLYRLDHPAHARPYVSRRSRGCDDEFACHPRCLPRAGHRNRIDACHWRRRQRARVESDHGGCLWHAGAAFGDPGRSDIDGRGAGRRCWSRLVRRF